ncbi:related to Putative amidase PB8B6.03 [Zygosaccharomyces bailii ISA1307]|nr:related to Putative amidase PB8B6.03 [Zygosaccharomyces bailii ISA1307]
MSKWELEAQRKRKQILDAIPPGWILENAKQQMTSAGFTNTRDYIDTIMPPNEVAITDLTVCELAKKISLGDIRAYEVCYSFCHRAAIAHQILNCCTEIFFERALQRAKELDQYFEETGKTLGPLHGIPVSLKDQFNLPGIDTTIGYVSYVGRKPQRESLLAKILEQKGAIFYVKTTVPMAMLADETESNLHGYTYNAINHKFTSGGSSGGEGALIAAGGSPIGLGTDIGGSIRTPASFQGLHALRPSHGRVTYLDVANSYLGQEVIPSVIGPLATSLGDVEMLMKVIVNSHAWEQDPKLVPLEWRDVSAIENQKLRFGVMWSDGFITPHPPITRALKETVEALKKAGHEVIEWKFPHQSEVLELAKKVFGADHGKEVFEVCKISGEPPAECIKQFVNFSVQEDGTNVNVVDVTEWWKIGQEKSDLREKFFEHWRGTSEETSDSRPIDALLCPVWPTSSFEEGESKYGADNYTVQFNVLDLASVILPVTTVSQTKDLPYHDFRPLSDRDEEIQSYYEPKRFDKMPVCIQVACRRLEEEKAIAIASVVENLLKA